MNIIPFPDWAKRKMGFLFSFFLLVFIGGRYETGGDWDSYKAMFEQISQMEFVEAIVFTDPGYAFLNWFSFQLGSNVILVNTLCAVIFVWGINHISYLIKDHWFHHLFLFSYIIAVVSVGYSRQAVAIAICCAAICLFIKSGRVKQFILFTILASLFHFSALFMMLFVGYFYSAKYLGRVVGLGLNILLILLVIYVLSDKTEYISGDISSLGAQARILTHIIPLFFYIKYKKLFIENLNKHTIIFLDYASITITILFFLSFSISTVSDRLMLYLSAYDILVMYVIFQLSNLFTRRILVIGFSIIYTLCYIVWHIWGTHSAGFQYHFFLDI